MAAEPAPEENVIEMRMIGFAIARACRPRGSLAAVLVLVSTALMAASAPALAAPAWRVALEHGPQNIAPGANGQYMVQLFNIGDADSSGAATLRLTLPAGITATRATGGQWGCGGNAFPTATVTCTYGTSIPAARRDASIRGAANGNIGPLLIDMHAAAGAVPGTGDAVARVSGGGAPVAAIETDPTPIDLTPAGFGFVPGSFRADVFDATWPAGSQVRQAGSHPFEMRVDFAMNKKLSIDTSTRPQTSFTEPDHTIKTLETKLPIGLIGDPIATPRCPGSLLNVAGPGNKGNCPANTQVGTIDFIGQFGKLVNPADPTTDLPVYNMVPPPGAVAAFALSFVGQPVWILVTLDPSDHYSVIARIEDMTEALTTRSAHLTLWGVPADPAHDPLRLDADQPVTTAMDTPFTGAPIKPFLTLPSTCGVPGTVQMRADSWDDPGSFTPWQVGPAMAMTSCDDARFHFDPTLTVQPEASTPSTPTAVDVELSVPQRDDTVADATDLYAQNGRDAAIPTPPLLGAKVVLPEGMSVSPSSADGLAACSPLQIGLGTNDDPTCPDASKIGTVHIETPLLPDPLDGAVYLAAQNDNPFGSLLAIYIVAKGSGVIVKLPGRVAPDPVTGQLTTTFDDNPPLPFSSLHLRFDGGPRAPLVTPPTCGVKTTTAELTSWNLQLPAVDTSDSFTIDGGCAKGFDPAFTAGTTDPVAGADSPLVTRFTRSDADQEMSTIDVSLPEGLLGHIGDVPLCPDGAADAGRCGDDSRIGTVTVAAGPGSNPFYITNGRVYITGPFKGAPYGLSIVVPAKAGPFDLGDVVVRAQVQVDRSTAALRIVSEPMPRILSGIPLQVRLVDVTVDRPHFTFNPTDCSELESSATLTSTSGATSTKRSRFQVARCGALPFHPHLSIAVGGRRHTRFGATTPLTAKLRMPAGNANLADVEVALPGTLNARLPVVQHACTLDEFHAGDCAKAKAGTAVATTPLLSEPLRGGIYFVKNGHGLPDLMVALRGQVAVDLDAEVTIRNSRQLVTDFSTIPDVPVSTFVLRIVSGSHGPLGVVHDLCTRRGRRAPMSVVYRAHNGKEIARDQRLSIVGCRRPARRDARRHHLTP